MIAWIIVAIAIMLTAITAHWANRGPNSSTRFAIVALASATGVVALGFYWEPSFATLAAVANASSNVPSSGSMNCEDAEKSAKLIDQMGNGLILVSQVGVIKLPTAAWSVLTEPQRQALIDNAQQLSQCHAKGRKITVLDVQTGSVIVSVG